MVPAKFFNFELSLPKIKVILNLGISFSDFRIQKWCTSYCVDARLQASIPLQLNQVGMYFHIFEITGKDNLINNVVDIFPWSEW